MVWIFTLTQAGKRPRPSPVNRPQIGTLRYRNVGEETESAQLRDGGEGRDTLRQVPIHLALGHQSVGIRE